MAAPCVAGAAVAFLAPEVAHAIKESGSLPMVAGCVVAPLVGFVCWPIGFLRWAVSRERIEGFRFARREVVIPPRAPGEAFASISVDGEKVGDTRGARVLRVKSEQATYAGRGGYRVYYDEVVLLKCDRTVFEIGRTDVASLAANLAEDLAGAIDAPPVQLKDRSNASTWGPRMLPAAFSGLLAVAALTAWCFAGHWPPFALRLTAGTLALAARFTELPLRLSSCLAAHAKAFGKFYGRAEPARPTEWLTPSLGARAYWVTHALLGVVLVAGTFVR